MDYLIKSEALHSLSLSWSGDRSAIFLQSNDRCLSLSPQMAQELSNALLALLKGDFDRAVSETSLQIEEARRAARNLIRESYAAIPIPPSKPELDTL